MSSFLKRQISYLISTILVFSISLFYPSQSSANLKIIQIGFQGPLSGEEQQVGQDQLAAVTYAVKTFNQAFAGTYQVEVVKIDDKGDPAVASTVAPGVAANLNIVGLVGASYSGASIASIPYYKIGNLPMISPSATRISLTDPASGRIGYPIFHRISSTDKVQGPFLYNLATRGVSLPRVFIVDDQSAYGVQLSQFIRAGSGARNIAGTDSVSDKTTNWSETISKVRASQSNVVIFTGYFPQAAVLFRQLRDSGFVGILAGGDGTLSPSILTLAPTSILNGVRMSAGTAPLQNINSDLEDDFRRKVGRSSGIYAAESIDATNVLLFCIAKGASTRTEMLNCIDSFNGKSIYGHDFSFDSNGDNTTPTFYGFEIVSGDIRFMDSKGRSTYTADEIIEEFPWWTLSNAKEQQSLEKENQVTKVISECTAYNDELNVTQEGIRKAAIEYPMAVQQFLLLLGRAPKSLNCAISDVAELAEQLSERQLLLSGFQREFNETEVEALEARASQKTITCTKGKKIKKISGTKPKCPKGYKKK